MKTFFTCLIILCSLSARPQGTWTKKTDFGGAAKYGAAAFSIGTKAYVVAGRDVANKKDVWEYNSENDHWSQKADFGGPARYQAVAFTIGNKGYVGTGAAGSVFPYSPLYNDLWEYDTLANTWTAKASFGGVVRFGAVGFSINNKGYIGTGFNDGPPYFQKDFWEYDPTDLSNGLDANNNPMGKWTQMNDFGGPKRMEAVGFSIGNKGYIGTGGDYTSGILLYNDFWEYDPASGEWTARTSFGGTPRSLAVGFSAGGYGYIGIGGNFINAVYPDFWQYNPGTNQWTQEADFGGTSRWLAAGFSIGDNGYIATGGNFIPTYKDLWEFTPSTTGIEEHTLNDHFSVLPSIGSGLFQVSSPGSFIKSIEIYASNGVRIQTIFLRSEEVTIDLSQYATGIYFIRTLTGEGVISKKIMIQNK